MTRTQSVIVVLGGFLLIWEAWVRLAGVPTYFLPAPSAIFIEIVQDPLWYARHSAYTVGACLLGFFMALAVGILAAIGIVYSKVLENTLYTFLVSLNSIPKIALAPLFIIWFGFGLFPKVFMTFLLSFFPIVIDSIAGFRSLDPEIEHLIRSMGLKPWPAFLKVRLPHALPHVFTGLKVAITLATVGAIIGEFVGSDRGLGYLLLVAGGDLRTELLFATLIVLTAIGLVLYFLVAAFERLAIPWHVSRRGPLGAEGGL
jgi:NitT/TauT family transport system permease protein